MTNKCYKCGEQDVKDEFERCPACQISHQELCAKLDAKPRIIEKKVKEELFPIREVKQGIKITTWISREDAFNMGIKI